jgi:hypothetical protein
MNTQGRLIAIEGKSNRLYLYVHLSDFKTETACRVFDAYIQRYEVLKFKEIKVMFWNTGIPGDFLSMFRRNINRKCTRMLLRGASYIEATFDYMNNEKTLNNPILVS